MPMDEWNRIARRSPARNGGPIPIREILNRSVYYPACGLDGDPVKYLGRKFQSFVYVDYGVGLEAVSQDLDNFAGYDLTVSRKLVQNDLVPNGWNPPLLDQADGNPARHAERICEPFAIWALFRRQSQHTDEHGPAGFSLLYIGGDGAACFHALFYTHKVAPAVICLIQPGTGFGGNWTDFEAEEGILARLVLGNPAGRPEFLLYGGSGDGSFYRTAPWTGYENQVAMLHGRLRLFSCDASSDF